MLAGTLLLFISTTAQAQNITLKINQSTFRSVMDKIEQQSGYDFWYNKTTLNENEKISIEVKDRPIKEVLKQLFNPRRLNFELIDKTIFIRTAPTSKTSNPNDKTTISGTVEDEKGIPIAGATVRIKDSKLTYITTEAGSFKFSNLYEGGILAASSIGFADVEYPYTGQTLSPILIRLKPKENILNEVQIVSTGYQNIPRERATGSFTLVDNEMLNRQVGPGILDRLDGITSGVLFNKNKQNGYTPDISIRGRSTLFANAEPLVVLDNFPYQGDINNINPNDIENITILKDAAAASIWGVKAGNGVIVITTKNGRKNAPPTVNINSNITIGSRPDIYYPPQLNSSDYISLEQFLFNKGAYNSAIATGYSVISPAVEIFLKKRNNTISSADSLRMINELKGNDVREDIDQYLRRKSINQQYSININGGGERNTYYISGGYDHNKENSVANSSNRLTLNAKNTNIFFKNRLEWTSAIQLTNSKNMVNYEAFAPLTPYERITDQNGNAVPTVKTISMRYADTAGNGRLQDWHYYPLNEAVPRTISNTLDYRLSTDLNYKIIDGLKISVYYLFQKGTTETTTNQPLESFYTRNLINSFSQINQSTGIVTYAIPLGDIVDRGTSVYQSNTGRALLSYSKNIGIKHQINALAGFEAQEFTSSGNGYRLYGYDASTAANANQGIDYKRDNPQYYGGTTARITNGSISANTIDRSRSYYLNASYSYLKRYILSGSARWDESNIFGVAAKQKGVPLWSTGLSWNISDEPFFNMEWLTYLRLRATYGYNGNTDKTTSAYLTTTASAINNFTNPTLIVINPPNPSLRWEKVAISNIGIDFSTAKGWLSGSIEYYQKNSKDLIGTSPIAPQTGITQFKGNSATMLTKGMEISLNTKLLDKDLRWNATLLFNYATDKVTKYEARAGSNQSVVNGNYINPLVGYPFSAIFRFPYAGLDNQGNPIGYLNGQQNNNYSGILNSVDRSNLKYMGSQTPLYFGSLINNFSYKNFDLSVNITYKLSYSLVRKSIDYTLLFRGAYQQADYEIRWQKPGDELGTNVPSLIYPSNNNRNDFYQGAEVLVEHGDHIRLRDIRFAYNLNNAVTKRLPFQKLQLFVYASNLGILWRANHLNLDPDFPNTSPVRASIAFGLRATL
ncbi:SusC/RagA family TonB-linked outer membrane protein [Pedobacter psychrodurus]|uniref:SusC/RagA family TonB-linked outer membrane protein n=1 Tax=Pedobacter psychrodurus TaxID=2530456 RepID=UPI0029302F76|nr:SusC/RagA family TonB-linked outer membrane protein [Pedobacter psychrodurus]